MRAFSAMLAPGLASLAKPACAQEQAPAATGIPNRAVVVCTDRGGVFETRTTPAGTQGMCHMPDGRRVEAWQFFRDKRDRPAEG